MGRICSDRVTGYGRCLVVCLKKGAMEIQMDGKQIFLRICKNLKPILISIQDAGGTSYMVGGSVRDLVLGRTIKDVDIEVHGLTEKKLELILKQFGQVILVGKKFGVLRLKNFDVDWSLPRTDSKGRKPLVKINPKMGIEFACKRRDLTMNAMAINLDFVCSELEYLKKLSGAKFIKALKIIDPFGGLKDISKKRLCAVDNDLFLEDPLRFFRVMQFIGRFQMLPDKNLSDLCKKMNLWDSALQKPLARERIFEEIKKLFMKSKEPSLGFRWLLKINRLKETFPELFSLVGIMQNPKYHPEGDVFEHTMQALDAAANLEFYDKANLESEKFVIMLVTLCHDLGKPETTDLELHAHGHAHAGVKFCTSLLRRLTNKKTLVSTIKKLVEHHCEPLIFLKDKASLKAYKRLASKLAPDATLRQLALVALADKRGRNKKSHKPFVKKYAEIFLKFMQNMKAANVENEPEPAVLLGRHLLDCVKPGPEMGRLLALAYSIQIDKGIKDWRKLKQLVIKPQ